MISERLYSEFKDILQTIKIISHTKFSFLNNEYELAPTTSDKDSERSISSEFDSNGYSGMRIRDILYNVYHCRNNRFTKVAMSNVFFKSQFNDTEDFSGSLSEANTGKGTWEPGWEVIKIEKNGQIVVHKNGLNLWVFPKQFSTSDGVAKIGKKGHLRMVREYRKLVPGFYMANSDASFSDHNKDLITVRFYWNIQASYAFSLMKHVTAQLNKERIPFRFKVLNNPHSYPRADAAVLYVHKQYIEVLKTPLSTVYTEIKHGLNDSTPLLAKKLASGLSLAEDPDNGESFGQHRCRILEESLHRVREHNLTSVEESILEIGRYFQDMKLSLDRPYLNPHSLDNYDKLFSNEIFA
jgi:HopA1 effector protein family